MNIDISFDTKSLNNAIKQLKNIRNQTISKMTKDYLQRCCEWVMDRANIYLQSSDVGDDVISDIKKSADIKLNGNICTLSYGEKAAFIEFGVGIVGQGTFVEREIPCPAINIWEYDTETGSKKSDRSWIFNVEEDKKIDIKQENIINRTGHTVRTKGNQATMFLYNAAMDFKSMGIYKQKWEEVKKEHLK